MESNSLLFEQFVEKNKEQIKKLNKFLQKSQQGIKKYDKYAFDLQELLKVLHSLDTSKNKTNLQSFISDESLEFIKSAKSNVLVLKIFKILSRIYMINPQKFEEIREIYANDCKKLLPSSIFNLNAADYSVFKMIYKLYQMFPQHITNESNDRHVLFSKVAYDAMNILTPEIVNSAYQGSDGNTDQFEKFICYDSMNVLKLKLMRPQDLLKLFLKSPASYKVPDIINLFCNQIIEIIEEGQKKHSNKDEVFDAIRLFTLHRLYTFTLSNEFNLQKSVEAFANDCINTALKHESGENISLKNKIIVLFQNFMQSSSIDSLYDNQEICFVQSFLEKINTQRIAARIAAGYKSSISF